MVQHKRGCTTMTTGLAAVILLSTLYDIQANGVSDPVALTVVNLGDKVTLNCNAPEKYFKFFHWYKQPLGQMVQMVASQIFGKETMSVKFKDSRFKTTSKRSQYFLMITNVSKEDEATYLCHSGTTFSHKFIIATSLVVNDHKHLKTVSVEQTELVQQGDLLTFQCPLLSKDKVPCLAEHSVHWFRAKSKGFHPGIIYIQRNISDEDVERSCSYSLSVQDSYDDEARYCAAVTCGAMLSAEGTNLKTGAESDPAVIVLGGLLVFCLTAIFLLIFYIKQKKVCHHGKGGASTFCQLGDNKSSVDQTSNSDGEMNEASYAAVQTRTSGGNKKIKLQEECVYSTVRLDHQDQDHS